jgi:uncharacterized protein (DUF885 family)
VSARESAGSPAALAKVADETWDGSMAAQPTFATSIGDPRFDDRLPDNSPGADAAERRRLTDLLARARDLPAAGLTGPDAITREALIAYLEMELDLVLAGLDRWTVDPLEGPQVHFLNLPSFQPLESPTEGRRLIERWRAMDGYLDRSIANLVEALDGGLVSPEAPIRAVLDELAGLLESPLADSPLMAPAAAERPAWTPAERSAFDAELESIVVERIQPAFDRYRRALLDTVLPRARSNERPGLGEVPGGDEAYRRLVRAHTSLDLSPEEIHATGLAEVERIDAELEQLAGRVLGTPDRARAIERLRTEVGLRFAAGSEILATAEGALARANAAVPGWFARQPVARCEVVEMGAHESKHSTIAYYLQPAEDGRRPGRYYLNTSAPQTRPRYEAEALAFHEAVPGHHLQLAIAQDLRELPAFRRHAGSTAFIEGWGLYSERLSDEMASIRATSTGSGSPHSMAGAPVAWSSTPASTPWAGRATGPSGSCSSTPRWRPTTSSMRSIDTSPGRARRWPTSSASSRSVGCATRCARASGRTSTSGPSTTRSSPRERCRCRSWRRPSSRRC